MNAVHQCNGNKVGITITCEGSANAVALTDQKRNSTNFVAPLSLIFLTHYIPYQEFFNTLRPKHTDIFQTHRTSGIFFAVVVSDLAQNLYRCLFS